MKSAVSSGLCIGLACLLSLAGTGVVNARKAGLSTTTRVTIDGKSYVSETFPGREADSLRRTLERLGVELPAGFEIPDEAGTEHPVSCGGLVESPGRAVPSSAAPWGLTAEHAIRLEGDEHSIELVLGRMNPAGSAVHTRLLSDGWVSASQEKDAGNPRVLRKASGKEAAVACLDETERTFLLVRKVVR